MKKFFYLSVLFSIMLLGSGCAEMRVYHAPDFNLQNSSPVAVIPFASLAGHPNAGIILAGIMNTELASTDKIKLIPEDKVKLTLAKYEGKNLGTAEIGKILQAKSLLTGQVTEYSYKRGVGEEPVIGLNLRLIDAVSGKVLWSCVRSEIGSYSWVREDSLSRLSQALCRSIISTLRKNSKSIKENKDMENDKTAVQNSAY